MTNLPRLMDPKVHYQVHKDPSLEKILSQFNPVKIFTSWFFKMNFNVISFSPFDCRWLFSWDFRTTIFCEFVIKERTTGNRKEAVTGLFIQNVIKLLNVGNFRFASIDKHGISVNIILVLSTNITFYQHETSILWIALHGYMFRQACVIFRPSWLFN